MTTIDAQHAAYMEEAVALAIENVQAERGGPFAALVTRNRQVIARGTNLVTSSNDPTAHAEIVAIRAACRSLGSFQLTGCDLYTTCEPCPMCMGAIYWARPDRVFYAATRTDAASAGFDDAFIYEELTRTPDERHIPMIHLRPEAAQRAFQAWQEADGKVSY